MVSEENDFNPAFYDPHMDYDDEDQYLARLEEENDPVEIKLWYRDGDKARKALFKEAQQS